MVYQELIKKAQAKMGPKFSPPLLYAEVSMSGDMKQRPIDEVEVSAVPGFFLYYFQRFGNQVAGRGSRERVVREAETAIKAICEVLTEEFHRDVSIPTVVIK